MAELRVERVTAWYPGSPPAISDVSAVLEEGRVTVLRGPNGSGKTTLLNTILGLHPWFTGRILHGVELSGAGPGFWAKWRATTVGVVPQEELFFPNMSVLDNIRYYVERGGYRLDAGRMETVREYARRLGIWHLLERRPHRLSGGERRKASLLRALAKVEAEVFIMDEPTASVDEESARIIADILRELAADGKIVVVASHDPLLFDAADVILDMRSGRLTGTTTKGTRARSQ